MDVTADDRPVGVDDSEPEAVRRAAGGQRLSVRVLALIGSVAVLVLVVIASLMIGSATLSPADVFGALVSSSGTGDDLIVTELRVPRTILGVVVGVALGLSGALIQALTRNPLADPGILGVNAGASFAIVLGVMAFGLHSVALYLPFAFVGAVAATVVVYLIARRGGGGATPVRLTLVGIALAAVLDGVSSTMALMNPDAFDRMRFWGAGSLADRPPGTILAVTPFIVVGVIIAFGVARSLNAVALGDDLAKALGARMTSVRIWTVVAVTLMCGAATAAAGPIAFIGLMIPHAVRWLTGPDQRWILAFTALLAPALLLVADIIGRVLVFPGELQVGIVAALLGAPILIILVRRTKASGL